MEQNVNKMPLIGDLAPSFKAVTTQVLLISKDYKGKWVILFHTQRILLPFAQPNL